MNDNDFFSIDRLIEFGLGMSVARQMVNVMNESMKNMYVPGASNMIAQPQTLNHIYVAIEGTPIGPLSEAEFGSLVTEQKVTKDTPVWVPGMLAWQPLEQVPAVLRIVALTPPPLPKK